jgi:hypothetical protein
VVVVTARLAHLVLARTAQHCLATQAYMGQAPLLETHQHPAYHHHISPDGIQSILLARVVLAIVLVGKMVVALVAALQRVAIQVVDHQTLLVRRVWLLWSIENEIRLD